MLIYFSQIQFAIWNCRRGKRNLKLCILNRKLNTIFREHEEAFCFLQNNENIGGSDYAKSKSNYTAKTVIKKKKKIHFTQ